MPRRRAVRRSVPDRPIVTIVIHGQFDRPDHHVAEIIDNALHDAGLCGCTGPGNGYTLSVRSARKKRPSAKAAFQSSLVTRQ